MKLFVKVFKYKTSLKFSYPLLLLIVLSCTKGKNKIYDSKNMEFVNMNNIGEKN